MVTWIADGGMSGFDAATASLVNEKYLLASAGMVDVQGATRLQYPLTSSTDRIRATARINITAADISANPRAHRLGAGMFFIPANVFSGVPTVAQILANPSTQVRRSSTTLVPASADGDHTLTIAGPRAGDLSANTKYWVLVIPTAIQDATEPPGLWNDLPMRTNVEVIGRGLSLWTNRTPSAPVITSPATGSVVAAGSAFTFTFTSQDPDRTVGDDTYAYTDMAGVQVQYAPRPTAANPNPDWTDLPIANISGPDELGKGWFISGSSSYLATDGAIDLWSNLTMQVQCGDNNTVAGYGALPSGDWQLRCRTFDYGHPYPGSVTPLNSATGAYTPDTYPASNTAPWSSTVNVTVSAQVPPPILLYPINDVAIPEGQPITLTWQYRNTAVPPFAQRDRLVQIRAFGVEDWTTLVYDFFEPSTSYTIPEDFSVPATARYEWRVQVTDADDVNSNFSETGRFWVVPAPASGEVRALPSETIEAATLGCGTHRIFIYRRGGSVRVGEIRNTSYIDWERVRDDISTSKIVVSGWDIDCGNLLAKLQTWAYEVVIFRDNGYSIDRVWEGPITLLTYEHDKVTIQAKDVMGYAYRRIIKQAMSDSANGDTVTSRAARVLQNTFAPDDPNVLAYLQVLVHEDDAMQYRSTPAYSRTAFEEVDDMAANAGLDYTAVGRSILLWGTKHRIGTLPEFRDEDLGSPPVVSEYGMSAANVYSVSDGNGIHGEATRLDVSGNDETYGLVEMLSSTWASDSPSDTGTYTQEGLATVIQSFEDYAERSISDRYPPPVVVRVPDNTTLNPGTVLSIQHLVPGVVIPLRSTGTLRQVVANQKLDRVGVVETSGSEVISITMSPFNRDDTAVVEGEG